MCMFVCVDKLELGELFILFSILKFMKGKERCGDKHCCTNHHICRIRIAIRKATRFTIHACLLEKKKKHQFLNESIRHTAVKICSFRDMICLSISAVHTMSISFKGSNSDIVAILLPPCPTMEANSISISSPSSWFVIPLFKRLGCTFR